MTTRFRTPQFKTLGVLGGMGPAATVDFLAKLQAATPATEDADHIRVLADINPRTPDRHTHGVAAGETLGQMTRALVSIGAEVIAMPCNTAHTHAETIRAAGGVPFIDMIDETVAAVRMRLGATGAARIGIMATPGGRALYQARLETAGLTPVILSPEDEKRLMGLIFAIKAKRVDRPAMAALAEQLIADGAQAIVAGCTEVPLALADGDVAAPVVDSSQALAEACVRTCLISVEPPAVEIEALIACIPDALRHQSGAVFYSGTDAFSHPSDLYLLGLNPGGSVEGQSTETVAACISQFINRPPAWSAYRDERWGGRKAGAHPLQKSVLHLLARTGRDPRTVPASNVIFARSDVEANLVTPETHLDSCWAFHQRVIDTLGVKVVVCFGQTAGRYVRTRLGAHARCGTFVERNGRGWTSEWHASPSGRSVVTLTHPSRANWTNADSDPSGLVLSALAWANEHDA